MTETVTRCLCDICKAEGAKTYQTLTYRTFDSTDGRSWYNPPQVRIEKIDLCDKCAIASTNIHSIGIQGDKYEIRSEMNQIKFRSDTDHLSDSEDYRTRY